MWKHFLAVLLALALPAAALAQSSNSATTDYPGTLRGNPGTQPAQASVHAQTYANVGHLAFIKSASMSSTSDQAFFVLYLPAKFTVTSVYAANCSADPSGATGGIYTAASKGGTAIVAAGQTFTGLTTTTKLQALTNNVGTSVISAAANPTTSPWYLHLDTAAPTGTPTCDLYIDGIGLQ